MGFGQYAAAPSSAFGYYRGSPLTGGEGSGMGPATQGAGVFPAGQGGMGPGGWHPTILYLGALMVVEMVVFGWLATKLR